MISTFVVFYLLPMLAYLPETLKSVAQMLVLMGQIRVTSRMASLPIRFKQYMTPDAHKRPIRDAHERTARDAHKGRHYISPAPPTAPPRW